MKINSTLVLIVYLKYYAEEIADGHRKTTVRFKNTRGVSKNHIGREEYKFKQRGSQILESNKAFFIFQ